MPPSFNFLTLTITFKHFSNKANAFQSSNATFYALCTANYVNHTMITL